MYAALASSGAGGPFVCAVFPQRGSVVHGRLRSEGLGIMATARIDAMKVRDQLTAKRNILFEQFLHDPTRVALVNEIRLIQTRMAELTSHFSTGQKSGHD